jgi:hypothetical protein
MSSIMRCRNGDIGLVIGELQLYELHMQHRQSYRAKTRARIETKIWVASRKIKVSATPCTERGTTHTLSSGVAETWLHETAVHESGYGDFALMSAVVGSDGVSLRRDDSKIRDEPCSPESL